MKLLILPYVNYLPLYNDLIEIKNFKHKIYKVGSIAKKCYENKTLTKLEIKRKIKEEIIDYTKDNKERDVNTLPRSIKKELNLGLNIIVDFYSLMKWELGKLFKLFL